MLGGTFNPVTCAHLALAQQALRTLKLDEVLFALPERLPHRAPREASLEQRLAMLAAALEPYRQFSLAVCSHGLFLDIARALEPHYPSGVRLYFLIGSDAAERILLWDYPDREAALKEMFARFSLVIARRAGELRLPSDPHVAAFSSRLHTLEMPAEYENLSASRVRAACRQGESLEEMVPPVVADYIREQNLYQR
ncbi:MAG: nicotinate-nicotinamide nucleotide adenylyltransferase [Acidobacteria bacterium]|nr:nicotinate-nicotinamide nucleotide adenylyltransferase [Acidobacteriota bacterium]